jgi:hypothetical protein
MAVVAWRLLKDSKERSAARIEVLHTLATEADLDEPPDDVAIDVEPEPVLPIRREPVRAPEPARAVRREPDPLPAPEPAPVRDVWDADLIRNAPAPVIVRTAAVARRPAAVAVRTAPMFGERIETSSAESAEMFAGAPARGASGRRLMSLGAIGLIIALAAGSVYALHTWDLLGAIASAAPASGAQPLELLSLRHSNEDGDTFVVTGLVENPLAGKTLRSVQAVIYLFDQDGRFLASGRAALDVKAFEPGDESPFIVKIPRAKGVSRYRVGFRFDDGGVVAHVDRRGQVPGGTTEDAIERGQGSGIGGAPIAPRRSEG